MITEISIELIKTMDEEILAHANDAKMAAYTGNALKYEYTKGLIDGLIIARNNIIKPIMKDWEEEDAA